MHYKLYLGNKAYSSWSLRGWLLLKPFDIPFEQEIVPLHTDEFASFRETNVPARQVPTLIVEKDGAKITIWESLAIAEYVNEAYPDTGIWPANAAARAAARSLSAEMHAGFTALRRTMPMNLRRRYTTFAPDSETAAEISRVCELWAWARHNWGSEGPYLFGESFTAADAFYTPIAARFRTYGIALDDAAKTYTELLLSHPAVEEFYRDAAAERWVLPHNELDID